MSSSHVLAPLVLADVVGSPVALPALDNTYGALFLGAVFGFMLYGLTVHQTYRYFRLYPTDIRQVVWMVIAIWALETFHTLLVIVACYFHLISNFFKPETLAIGHWSTRLITPTTGATILICQCFYARRVYYVGPRYRYLVVISIASMIALVGFTTAATVEGFILPLSDFHTVSWLVSAMFGFAVLTDIVLTTALVVALLRNRTGFKRTDSIIEILIVYSINTGLLTSIFGLLCFIFAIILPGNFIYIGISIVGTKLYANSVLAVLNSRRALSNQMLEGFELDTYAAQRNDNRPHTALETWDVPQNPRYQTDTRISFATPAQTNQGSTSTSHGSSTARERTMQLSGSGGTLRVEPDADKQSDHKLLPVVL